MRVSQSALLSRLVIAASGSAWLLFSSQGWPQTGSESAAAAETLFDDARRLLGHGRYAEACPKLEESQRLDPAVGTLLYLALCYERSGRTASAWSTYRAAQSTATQSGQLARARIARQHAAELESRLPRLQLRIAPDGPEGLKVTRNGIAVGRAMWGQPLPVDPGDQVIEARLDGMAVFYKTVRVSPGELRSVDVRLPPRLEPPTLTSDSLPAPDAHVLPTQREEPPQRSPLPPSQRELAPKPEPAARGLGTQRWIGIGIGVLGAATLGIGAGYAARSAAMASDAERYRRPGTNIYDQPGYSINAEALDAKRAAILSTIVGSLSLTSGLVIYFTAPARGSRSLSGSTRILVGVNGFELAGAW